MTKTLMEIIKVKGLQIIKTTIVGVVPEIQDGIQDFGVHPDILD
jgi:hypothetical protein